MSITTLASRGPRRTVPIDRWDDSVLTPGATIDRYRIESLVGSGGMAFVYLATDTVTSERVALKLLRDVTLDHQRRLEAEGRIQGALRHPNLVGVRRVFPHEVSGPALVLEFIDGPPLDAATREVLRWSLQQVDVLGRDVLSGLAHAHAHGLVHRDLKLGNVLLSLTNDTVVAKVADFGLAKIVDGDGTGTRSQAALGTPAYMAPEQIRDARRADARADVYATGVMLYELLTGQRPFPQRDLIERFEASRRRAYVPIGRHRPDAPARMVDAIEAALSFDRLERPRDGQALLEQWANDTTEPVRGAFGTRDLARLRHCAQVRRQQEEQDASLVKRAWRGDPPGSAMGPEPRRRRPAWPVAVVTGLLTTTTVVGLGAPRQREAPDPPLPAELTVPVPVRTLPPVAASESTPVPLAAPPPTRPRPSPAEVVVSGVAEASLVSGDGVSHAVGQVPAGRYRLMVNFAKGGETVAAELEVRPGERVRVACVDAMRTCRVRR